MLAFKAVRDDRALPFRATERAVVVLERARLDQLFDPATDRAFARARELPAGA